MSYAIAIAAPIGGGKTALVNAPAKSLGDAPIIYFDHYECATENSSAIFYDAWKQARVLMSSRLPVYRMTFLV